MRLRDLVFEDKVIDEINNDLMDILITFKRKGEKTIPMHGNDGLLSLLKKAGFDVTVENIMKTLSADKFTNIVKRSDTKEVTIKTAIPDTAVSKKEQKRSEDKVAKMAAKASKKALKAGDLK